MVLTKKLVFIAVFVGACLNLSAAQDNPFNRLKEGNRRFVNKNPQMLTLALEDRKQMAAGQTPFVTIVACSDSRVPPEIIFDQGPGEVFIVRLAGNTVDEFALASIEFGLSYLKTPLLVVLGHENCGAVQAAFNLQKGTHNSKLTSLLQSIKPSTEQAARENPGKSQKELLDIAINLNTKRVLNKILTEIPEIQNMVDQGRLQTETGVFKIRTGEVTWN